MATTDYDFDEAVSRLRAAIGLRTQTETAQWLGITQSALSCAYRRKTLPPQWLLTALRKIGLNPDWVLYGDPHPHYLATAPQEALETA